MLTEFGGRISEKKPIWVQGESNDSEKKRQEIIQKIKQRKIEIKGAVLIGRHCQIEDGARIVNSCIDNFTRVGKDATIENSAVMDRAIIGEKAEVIDSIIGRHVTVRSSRAETDQDMLDFSHRRRRHHRRRVQTRSNEDLSTSGSQRRIPKPSLDA